MSWLWLCEDAGSCLRWKEPPITGGEEAEDGCPARQAHCVPESTPGGGEGPAPLPVVTPDSTLMSKMEISIPHHPSPIPTWSSPRPPQKLKPPSTRMLERKTRESLICNSSCLLPPTRSSTQSGCLYPPGVRWVSPCLKSPSPGTITSPDVCSSLLSGLPAPRPHPPVRSPHSDHNCLLKHVNEPTLPLGSKPPVASHRTQNRGGAPLSPRPRGPYPLAPLCPQCCSPTGPSGSPAH